MNHNYSRHPDTLTFSITMKAHTRHMCFHVVETGYCLIYSITSAFVWTEWVKPRKPWPEQCVSWLRSKDAPPMYKWTLCSRWHDRLPVPRKHSACPATRHPSAPTSRTHSRASHGSTATTRMWTTTVSCSTSVCRSSSPTAKSRLSSGASSALKKLSLTR